MSESEMQKINEQKYFSVQSANSHQNFKAGRWTQREHSIFIDGIIRMGIRNWKKVTQSFLFFSWKNVS
jgi:hypothetical protein